MSTANFTRVHLPRPERFLAADLFPDPIPDFVIDGDHCDIENISASGVACLFPSGALWKRQSASSVDLLINQSGHELYSGKASIRRINFQNGRQFAGISFDDAGFSLADLRLSNAMVLFGQDNEIPDHECVPEAYKSLCADFLGYIAEQLSVLAAHPDQSGAEADKVANDHHEQTKDEWLGYIERLNRCVLGYRENTQVKAAVKRFTENLITPLLSAGECWRRSYTKPLGYPGDYQIMNYAYDFEPLGDALPAKYLHLVGVTSGRLILSRMDSLVEMLTAHAVERPENKRFKVISIGSGPAREIESLARAVNQESGRRLDAVLVDSEPAAIAYAEKLLSPLSEKIGFDFDTMNVSIRDIVSERYSDAIYRNVNVIYSSGLFDYLGPRTARRYVEKLYAALEPGGRVIIGNVNDKPTGAIWVMEYATDWGLYFRNDQEMLAMAEGLADAKVTLTEDANASVYFLVVEKPIH